MKKIKEMSDSQKENIARWLPAIIAIVTAIISFLFTAGYTSARLDYYENRISKIEKEHELLMQMPLKISNIESNTANTNAQINKLSDELRDIFKNYEMKHK